jgi:flagellar protein FliT
VNPQALANVTLAHYRELAEAYGGMLEAARRGDWDAVTAAELGCRARIEKLRALGEVPLDAAANQQKFALLQRLLADDAEIRDLALPWMRRLEDLIAGAGQARRVALRYGTAP